MIRKGLQIKVMPNVNKDVRKACIDFGKWIRGRVQFPILLRVYIKAEYRISTKDKKSASALFFAPYEKTVEPYIKISTGDYEELKTKNGRYSALMSIINSFSHELIHYVQWCNNKPLKEKDAKKEGEKLALQYSDFKKGLLLYNAKGIYFLEKADRMYELKQFRKSIKYYDKVIVLNPECDLAYYEKGQALDCLEEYQNAIFCYNKAIELNPDNDSALVSKGYCFDMLEQFEEALSCYDRAIEINPNEETTYSNKGYSLHSLKRFDEALVNFDKAIEINNSNEDYYIFKGDTLKCLEDYGLALEAYLKAVDINPDSPEAYFKVALVYAILNQPDMSVLHLNKAIDLDIDYERFAKEEDCFKSMGFVERD